MANDIYNYSVMTNTGKGFITHEDSRAFWLQGFPANVWVCDDIPESRDWGARNSASTKTKAEAQTLVTNAVNTAKSDWDDNNVEGETEAEKIGRIGSKPTDITLP